MKSIAAVTLIVLLSSCSTAPQIEEVWFPSATGCFKQSLLDTLYSWQDAQHERASFRFAIAPDLGMVNEPIFLALVEDPKSLSMGQPAPSFLAAWGDREKTCVVRMPIESCPAASIVHANLTAQSIPLGFDFGNENSFVTVLHGDMYFLEYSDGQNNDNQWSFHGTDHPLQSVLDRSREQLMQCSQSALDAYHGL